MSTSDNHFVLEILKLFPRGVDMTVATLHDELRKKKSLFIARRSVRKFISDMHSNKLLVVTKNPKRPIRNRTYRITPKGVSFRRELAKNLKHPNKCKPDLTKNKKLKESFSSVLKLK